ncbi:MAG: YciI family protein, partial [Myxococcota bacterium]
MEYLILIYSAESEMEGPPSDPEGMAAYMKPWLDYNAALQEAGVFVSGEPLQPTSTATTITA